jgi:hypothetical protein
MVSMHTSLFSFSMVFFIISIPLLTALQALESAATPVVELSFTKRYSSLGILPRVNDYVSYDFTIKNISSEPLQNQSLWVTFVSESNVTSVHTKFHLPLVQPNAQTLLHLGPFKMREAGQNSLYLGINRDGDSSLANDVSLNLNLEMPVDSVTVYDQAAINVVIFGSLSVVSGIVVIIVIMVLLPLYRRKKDIEK